jgi:hypothetical protein
MEILTLDVKQPTVNQAIFFVLNVLGELRQNMCHVIFHVWGVS